MEVMEVRINVKEACRLCLQGEGKLSVFENDSNFGSINAETIFSCVSITIDKEDNFPKGICSCCLQSLEEWSSFKVTCARSQELLQAWLREDVLEKQEIVLKPEVVKENLVNLMSPFKNVHVPNSASQVDKDAVAGASPRLECPGEVKSVDTDPALQSSLELPLPTVSCGVLVDGKPADVSESNEFVSSEIPPVVHDDKDSKNIADSDDFLSRVGQTDVPSSSAEAFDVSESYETSPLAFLQQNNTLGSCLDHLLPPVPLGDLVPEGEHTDPSQTFAVVLEDNVSDDAVANDKDIDIREAVATASREEAMEISESVETFSDVVNTSENALFKKETTPDIESSLDVPLPPASPEAMTEAVVPENKLTDTLESQEGSAERPAPVFESKDFMDLLTYDKETDVVVASREESMGDSESIEAYPDPVNPAEPTSFNKNPDPAIKIPVDVTMPPPFLATATAAVVTGSKLTQAIETQEVISSEISAIVLEDKLSNAAGTDVVEIDAAKPVSASNEVGVDVFESFGIDHDTISSLKKYSGLASESSLEEGIPSASIKTAISEVVPEDKLPDATSETTTPEDNHSDDFVTTIKRPSDVLDPEIVSSKAGTMKVSESFATCTDVNYAGSASLGEPKDLGFVVATHPPSTAVSINADPGSSQVINNDTLAIISEDSDPKFLAESDVSMSNINAMEVSERSDVEDTKEVSKSTDATYVKHSSETTTLEKPTELLNIVATESVVPGANSSTISENRKNSNETSTDVMNSSKSPSCEIPIESIKPTETTVSLCVPDLAEESSIDISSNVVKTSEHTFQEKTSGLLEVVKTVSIRESESVLEKLERAPNPEKTSPFKIPLVILKSGENSAIERPALDPLSDQPSTDCISLCSTDELSENEEVDEAQLEGNIKINEVCSLTKLDEENNERTCEDQPPTSGVKTPLENVEDQRGVVSSSVVTPTDEKEVSSSVGKPFSATETPEPRVERPIQPTSQPPFPAIRNIKEEPIDSTTEEITASQRFLRVKSEFSGIIGEEMIEEETDLSSSDDPTNTDCRICQRKYSSVRAYKAHLRTKTHLANEGLSSPVIPKEQPPEPVPSLESPLLRSRLSSEPLQVPGFFESDNDSAWSLGIDPPPMKRDRPFIDHCALCNISFRVVYDVKRHRLSKKHRLNERIARAKQSRRPPPSPVTPHLLFEPAPSHAVESRPPPSIFICPMQSCRFSCDNGDNLLLHMKAHGFGQPLSAEGERPASSKFSYTHRQSVLRREAEARMKREAEVRMRRDEEIRKYRELELKVEREVELNKRRESELQMLRMGDAGMRRHPEDQFLGHMNRPPVRDAYGRFKCEACGKVFVRESGLRKHSWYCCPPPEGVKQREGEVNFGEDMGDIGDEHLASREAPPAYTAHCPLCDISFTARNVFINHVQIYHKGSYLESCLPQTPVSPMNLPHQPLIKSPLPAKKYTKPTMKAPSVQVANKLRITNKTHGFNCEICGKKFNLLSSLNFHLKSHTTGIKHICRICKQPFANKRHFTDHCRQHFVKHGSKEELCHECFKVFKTRSDLFQHKKNGQCSFKLKIYSCNICDHSFKESSALEKHKVRFHSESLDISEANNATLDELSTASGGAEYPFVSLKFEDSQPSTSTSASNWISRESIDPNPSSSLHCSICNKTFTWKSSLVKHNNTFHSKNKTSVVKKVKSEIETSPLKPWKCKHCKSSFTIRKSLINHLRKCDYNAIPYEKGVCLQCGGPTSSAKSMICAFCLPAIALDWRKLKKFQKSNEIIKKGQGEPSSQKLDEEELVQVQKAMKEEFLKSEFESQRLEESDVDDKGAVKDATEKQKSNLPGGVRALMKCPVGQKYFRNELLMLRHYAECDGSCENRCSSCRKPFTSAGEYQHHLLVDKCKKTSNFSSKKKSKNKIRYPTFACKKKRPRRDHSNGSESKPLAPDNALEESSDNAFSTYSEEGSMLGVESIAGTSQSEELDEKCAKLGRICTFCNKVINYHRAYYRHYYICLKRLFARKITVSCPKCKMSFSKQAKKIDIGLAIKQHILKCHFIPYYPGEGLLEDGSHSNVPPEHMCYVCSFGFTSEEGVREHVKLHKGDKDEVNRQVLQLEEILLGEERMTSQDALTNLYLDTPPLPEGSLAVKVGRSLSLLEESLTPTTKIYKCDVCFRKFLNENKYLRHKRIHGIIEERVLKKVRLDVPSEDESDVIVLE